MTSIDRPRPSYRPSVAVLALAAAGLFLLAAACGGGPSTSGGSSAGPSTGSASAIAYSACVRAHGVPNFPDPGSGGQVPKANAQQLGVSSSQLHAAQQACAHLIPTEPGTTEEQQQELRCGTDDTCPAAVVEQWMSGLRQLAGCLRSHGEPRWPDPVIASLGGHPPEPHFPYEQAGIDHHSPAVLAQVQACVRLTGFQGLPLP